MCSRRSVWQAEGHVNVMLCYCWYQAPTITLFHTLTSMRSRNMHIGWRFSSAYMAGAGVGCADP